MIINYFESSRNKEQLDSIGTHLFIFCSFLPEEMDPKQQEEDTLPSPTNKLSVQERTWMVLLGKSRKLQPP